MSGATPVTATQVSNTIPNNQPNAMGVSAGGTAAWTLAPQNPTVSGNVLTFQLYSYNPTIGTWTNFTATVDTTGVLPAGVTAANIASGGIVAGAVDPLSGNFYWANYANAPINAITIFGWNTSTNTSIGVVATSTMPESIPTTSAGTNGDLAFDRNGNLYVVSSVNTFAATGVIPGPLPTTPQTSPPALSDTTLATYSNPSSNAYNGIAFDNTGSLYLEYSTTGNSTSILKVNPNTGAVLAGPATVNYTGTGGTIGTDLGACSAPPVMELQKNVVNRQADTDQFNLAITGPGISGGNTATTTGTANGVQSAIAGPVLGVTGTGYTFAETGAGTTTMANYTTTWRCIDEGQNNLVIASGTGQSFNLTLPVPAPTETGQFVICTFTNSVPRLLVSKSVVPPSNTWVTPGQSLTYTLTFDNSGGGQPATVNYTDNLTGVLDDATVTTPPKLATGSGLTVGLITSGTFPVTGTLAAGATATVTYTVTVNNPDTGDHQLANFVVPEGTTPPPTCLSSNPACTINFVAAAPGFTTTILPPSATTVGNNWGDTATVAGNSTGGAPTGLVSWTLCQESAPPTPCTGGTGIGSTGTSTTSGNNSAFTLPNAQTPTAVGTYCFNASFAATSGGHYLSVASPSGSECFTVTPATSSSATTASPMSVVIGPTGTATDSITVTGNATGGAPTGTVAFTVCGPSTGPALCPSGAAVPPTSVSLNPGSGITSSATSGTFTPTSTGTWCFAAVYTPASASNYTASSDNIAGTADPAECFTVGAATPGLTTTMVPPPATAVGNAWSDTATVAGNSAGGTPTGTASWTLCQVVSPATSCTGGTGIGSTSSRTTSGNNSTYTLPAPQTPSAVGTYCFNASYAATPGGNYTNVAQQAGTECFSVTPATSSSTTTASPTSVVIGPTGTATDAVTVTGNPTGGAPSGTVAFSVCGPLPGPALCPSGTAVAPTTVPLSPATTTTSSATSGIFTATSIGTWCFAAVYTPGSGSNYTGSSDNVAGTADPAECFAVAAATPAFTTAMVAPGATAVGNTWADTATVSGNSVGGAPRGTVSWTLCQESAASSPCTGGTPIGSASPTPSGNNSTYTLPNPQTPSAVGTYCFNASFAAAPNGPYTNLPQQSGTECFSVTAASSSSATTASPGSVVIGPTGTATDTATVTGNPTGGPPDGTVAFSVCGPLPGPALCPSGTVVAPVATLSPATADTSRATSGTFTPTAVGTWCFASVYTPGSGSNYTASNDNVAGTPDPTECLSAIAVTSGLTTTIVTPAATAVGNSWGDTATALGNSVGGPPTGTVSWTLCQESAPSTPCTGGSAVGSTTTSTPSGNNSTFTLPTAQTPTAGTWCFNASFAATPGGPYANVPQQTGTECFSVTPAPPSSDTIASPGTVVIAPTGTATDAVTVTGNPTGGAPSGTVAFSACGPLPGPALCTSGTAVAPTTVPLIPGTGITSSATSGTFTPTAIGTWCFAVVYTPATGSNYTASSDNVTGNPDSAECFAVTAATPGLTTTMVAPSATAVGNPWGDTATVAGNSAGGAPRGAVSWTLCQVVAPARSCTGGAGIGSIGTATPSGNNSTFTLPTPQAPTVGTWCFNASYAPTPNGNYTSVPQQSGTECFTVTPATSSSVTTASPISVVIGPTGTATDAVSVTGNATGGAPTGTEAFTVCGPLPGPALCPSGTPVPPTSVALTPTGGITSSAASGTVTPTSVGTWCFAAVYTPATASNYTGSSDNIAGTADPAECFAVTAATPELTTTILPPAATAVGNPWGDTATVVGNSAAGAPTGTVSWTLCQESAPPTPCTSGTGIGSTGTSTPSGNNSTFTLPTPQAPTVGTWCFNASYAATPGGNYTNVAQQSGTECFSVTPATSSSATAASPTSVVVGPNGTVTDAVTVTGNATGGPPTGTVAFGVCGPSSGPALCPSGTAVPPVATLAATGGLTSGATSGTFTPTSVGTWCFAAVYTPAAGSNYTASSDNIAGTADPAECFIVTAATPGFTTTVAAPTDTAVGNPWVDTATALGNSAGGPPTGTVSWTLCQESLVRTPCTGGTLIGSTSTSTPSGNDSTFTLPSPPAPTVGTWCFNASYAPSTGGNYTGVLQQSGTECFTVTPASSSSATTASPISVVIGPAGTATDAVTVTGNATGGAPTGTVAFGVCGPLPGPAVCPSGTSVPPTSVSLTPGAGNTSSATSGTFTPTSVGTWCFAAVYTPATGSNYTASSDNVTGTADPAECFGVGAATPGLTTTIVPPSATSVGNTWGDTATALGNSVGGAPRGTVTWTLCQESAPPAPCTGVTSIGSDNTPTPSGNNSTYTLPNPQTPTVGTWCFNASYVAAPNGNYTSIPQQTDTECFTVTPAPSSSATTASPGSVVIGPTGTSTDSVTITGNAAGGAPTGTVAFSVCGPLPGPALCTSGTAVPPTSVSLTSGSGITSSATSGTFTPDSVGTWCFAAVYTPATGSNYTASSDNVSGTADPAECLSAIAVASGLTTTILPPGDTSVGNTWGDTATALGNSVGGPPTGAISWTLCQVLAPATSCTGGNPIGSTATSTPSGNNSTFTLPTPQAPTTGTFCFNASFAATPGGDYSNVPQQTGTECFTVTPATSSSATTASPISVVIGPAGTATDSITVTGNPTGGAPTGTVAFSVCGPLPGPALCPSGAAVPPTTVSLTPGTGNTSSATSGTFTPTSVGTWCFAAVYTPATGSNYTASSDNVTGTADPAECFGVGAATPGLTTTIVPPSATSVGKPWGDTATVAGNSVGGAPRGAVSWTVCQESVPPTPCAGGIGIGSDNSPTPSGDNSTFTLPNAQAPTVGTWCFNAFYVPSTGGNYQPVAQQSGTECFTVTPAPSSSTTTASPSSVVIGPTGTATDAVTVTGNATGGPPDGTVALTVCGPLPGPALCPSGTAVPPVATLAATGGNTSGATSGTFTPTSVGTWCFAVVYTPGSGSNYLASSDNVAGTADPAECFAVTAATPGLTTTIVPPSSTSVGNPWGDTAIVAGTSAGGAPGGTVSWALCQVVAPATSCTGGTGIGSDNMPTLSGNNSTYTLPTAQAPTVGTYCFNASYSAAPNGNYTSVPQQAGTECFAVTPANSLTATTASPGSVVIGPTGNATDAVTVTGNPTGGPPDGTVAFSVCGPLPGPALCPSGTAVPPTPVTLTPGTGITSSATSGTLTPTSVGTYCFAAVYTTGTGSNYTTSSDNVAGMADPAECFAVSAAAPGFTTTVLTPAVASVGNTWGDLATLAGNSSGGPPIGTISWDLCQEIAVRTPCTGGTAIGSDNSPTTNGDDATFTLDTPPTPTVGTWCFNASYTAAPGGNYSDVHQQTGAECFTVSPATSSSATTASPGSVVIGPTGTATDAVTVTGTPTGGPPDGTVAFTVCGPLPGPALCPSGTVVPPTSASLIPATSDTSAATSGTFTPGSVGTWCFAAVYTPGAGSNYMASSDNVIGTADLAECFTVTASTPGLTTTIVPPSGTAVGNIWGDTATVVGNSAGGAPGGTVSWTLCQESAPPTPCTDGTPIGSDNSPTPSGDNSTYALPNAQAPTVGTWCFNASYAAAPNGNYTSVPQQAGTECFAVTPATSSSATTASPGSIVIGPAGTATDSVTVRGNPTGGPPDGTVAFSVCGPLPGPALCPSGTAVPPVATLSPATANTSSVTSGTFGPPTQVGTYCFAAVYTPGAGSNFTGSSDNVVGTSDPAECFVVAAATNGMITTILPPIDTSVGNTWGDTATVVGNSAGGLPTGTISWTLCQESAPATPCTGGTPIGSTGTSTPSGDNSIFTLPNPRTPSAVGSYCFNASYAATPGGNYSDIAQQSGTECFSVTPATSSSTTTASPSSVVIGPAGTATDAVTVTGNPTGGPPDGTVAFSVCGPLPGPALCASGTAVPPTPVSLSPVTVDTSSATSGTFTPTSVGTWCFAAVYTPGAGSNYQSSNDNIAGTTDPAECFNATAASPGFTTTAVSPSDTSVGNTWGDTATVAGNAIGGAPTGAVSWTLCQESAPATPCIGGAAIGSDSSPTSSGNDSTFTLPNAQAPTVGTWCFNASYTAAPNGNYTSVPQQAGTECFSVTPATSSSATTASPGSVVIGPAGTATDAITVTGNPTGGPPDGTVAFSVCGPLAGKALCPSGAAVPPTSVALTASGEITSGATSGTFTPTAVGTWCFAAVYTPAPGSNYQGSSDNVAGTADPAECFSVTPATPGFTTTIVSPSATAVGSTWGDTATVAGNSASGPPTGTVNWALCQVVAPATSCTGGTGIGSTGTSTRSGDDSTFTLPAPQAPTVGTYCFNASYAATPGGNYSDIAQQSGTECFSVTPASSSSATGASPISVVIGPTGTATDAVTVRGNPTGGPPDGTVAFSVCGPLPNPALCPSGTAVPPTPMSLAPTGGTTSNATSGTFTPTSLGTWCFAAIYTPGTGSNYTASSDNLTGTADPAECLSVSAATPGLTTTAVAPSDTSVGNAWRDTATVAGNSVGGPPTGTVGWTLCQVIAPATSCTGGTGIGSTTTSTTSGNSSTFTLPNAQAPTVGTWCFNASYAATPGGNYTNIAQQSGTECFSVTPASSSSATTASPTSVVIGPTGTATDAVTVTGNPTGGPPNGTVAFSVCGPLPGPALCPSGTAVPPVATLSATGGTTSSASSGTFTPTAVGTWCFAAGYTPATGSNYTASSDNIAGTADTAECFGVGAAPPGLTTTIVPPSTTSVGNTWGDTATVTGNSAGGPPTGTISWALCQESPTATPCTGGTGIGSDNSPTTTGDDSTFTLPNPQTPTAVGTYCFNASYAATPGGSYTDLVQQTGAECFTVNPAPSSSATAASTSTVVIGPTGTATDAVIVTGNPTGGAPTGTVAFSVCGPLPGPPALCPSGTAVPPTSVSLTQGTVDTSSATSGTFTPTSVGTWCFAGVYAPATGSNYQGSSDNVTGTADTAECFAVTAARPGLTTTDEAPSGTAVGNPWGDAATVAGNSAGGPPTGTVSWTLCQVVPPATSCTGGTPIGSSGTSTASGDDSRFTLPNPQTPPVGTWCFNVSYAATPGGNYSDVPQQSDTECFTVTPPSSSTATTASPTSVVIGPTGTATDAVTVTGNPTDGPPDGTVAFSVCGPLPGPALCPSGTAVPPTRVNLTLGAVDTSNATSGTFTPNSIGTWCFAAVYTPGAESDYQGSSDNITGTAEPAECFSVGAATPGLTSTIIAPTGTSVGNTWGDTVTVAGSSVGGPPTGTVSWTLCQVVAPATSCTGGAGIGSDDSPTTTGDDSTFTLPTPQTPSAAGIYCFNESYTPSTGGNYQPVVQQSGTECFMVTAPMFTVIKTVAGGNGSPVSSGAVLVYTILIENIGDATGSAVVTDAMPSQVAVASSPACAVTGPDICAVANPSGDTWTLSATLAPNHTATVTVSGTVAATATGTIVNTATISTGPCIVSDACSSSVSNPIDVSPPANISPITPTRLQVTG
jgi:hypothetical protein